MYTPETEFELRTLAHDINGMLTSAKLIVEILMRNGDRTTIRRYEKLDEIVDRISNYCAEAVGDVPFWIGEHDDTTDVVISALSDVEPLAIESGINCTLRGDPVVVHPNEHTKIHRILVNLIRNAFAAQRRSGGRELLIDVTVGANMITIDICDDGPGLPDNIIAEHWPTVSRTIKHKAYVCGLGLRSSAAMAEDLGGCIHLLKTSSTGTIFRIELPRQVVVVKAQASA